MKQPRNTLSILYYLKRGHLNRNGECPVMCRISVRGEKETFSSHVYTSPDNWDVKSARVIGRTAKVIEQNKILTDLQVTLTRHYYDIEQRNGYVTAEMIKNAYMGITAKAESLLPIYKEFLEETEALIGIQKSKKTYEKYERCYRRVVEFLRDKYHVSDIAFRDLKPMFLVDFEVWLATKKNCSTNTIYKFLQLLRMPVLKAKRMGIVFKDPYEGYKMKKVSVDRGYLTEEEVIAIATHEITIPRLEQVRDIFIFCCYTGLAYSDVAALRQGNIQKMFDGRLWIVTHRQKTKTNVNVPLLPMAKKILEKYNWEEADKDAPILPVVSNQKSNAYLKEIGDICGVEKHLTFHLARHTFATTMTLGKGVPIESVSKMLGHTNISTTQIYARITNDKISKDMDELSRNLGALDF